MNPILSIIIPVYQVEKYINKCLQSVYEQSFEDFECIIVNDGSTDNSVNICRKFIQKDHRFSIINKKNGGLSSARNVGINLANGEYIAFIDSDDFILPSMFEVLMNAVQKSKSDIAICQYCTLSDGKNKVRKYYNIDMEGIYTGEEMVRLLFLGKDRNLPVAWNKVYKTSLFRENNIRFPHGKLHEDSYIMHKLYFYAKKITYIPQNLYVYLQRNNGLSNSKNIQKEKVILEIGKNAIKFVKENSLAMQHEAEYYAILSYVTYAGKCIDSLNYSEAKKAKKLLKKLDYKKNPFLKGRRKIIVTSLDMSIYLFILVSSINTKMKEFIYGKHV